MNSLFFELFEVAEKYVEIKGKKNPMVTYVDRAEEFALMELRNAVQKIENYLKEED